MRFRIALPGKSIKDNSPKDTVISELYPNIKINTKANPPHVGIIFVNWSSTTTKVSTSTSKILHSFAHGYGYIPSVFGTFTFDNGSTKQGGTLPFQYGALGMLIIDADTTNVNLKFFSFDGGVSVDPFTLTCRFYVMAERGKE